MYIFCVMLLVYACYITTMLLLVSCMGKHEHLLYFARYSAGSTPNIDNENIQQKTLAVFITIPAIN